MKKYLALDDVKKALRNNVIVEDGFREQHIVFQLNIKHNGEIVPESRSEATFEKKISNWFDSDISALRESSFGRVCRELQKQANEWIDECHNVSPEKVAKAIHNRNFAHAESCCGRVVYSVAFDRLGRIVVMPGENSREFIVDAPYTDYIHSHRLGNWNETIFDAEEKHWDEFMGVCTEIAKQVTEWLNTEEE